MPNIQTFRHGWAQRNNIHVEPQLSDPFDGYAVTWHFGYLAIQVVGFDTNDERFNALGHADLRLPDGQVVPAAGFTQQVFPERVATVKWAPPMALEEQGMTIWAEQPPYLS